MRGKIIFLTILLVTATLYFTANTHYKLHSNTAITHLHGKLFVMREQKAVALKSHDILHNGDFLITNKHGEAVIEFGHDSTIKLLPKTQLQILALNTKGNPQQRNVLYLRQGSIFISYHNPDSLPFLIESDIGKVRVTGTKFLVVHNPKEQKSKVTVLEGVVEVSKNSGQQAVPVRALQAVSISAQDNKITHPKKTHWAKRINWNRLAANTNCKDEVQREVKQLKMLTKGVKGIGSILLKTKVIMQKITQTAKPILAKFKSKIDAMQKTHPAKPKGSIAGKLKKMQASIKKRNDYLEQLMEEE